MEQEQVKFDAEYNGVTSIICTPPEVRYPMYYIDVFNAEYEIEKAIVVEVGYYDFIKDEFTWDLLIYVDICGEHSVVCKLYDYNREALNNQFYNYERNAEVVKVIADTNLRNNTERQEMINRIHNEYQFHTYIQGSDTNEKDFFTPLEEKIYNQLKCL